MLVAKIRELKEERARLVTEQRGILDKASAEKRRINEAEDVRWNAIEADSDRLTADIAKYERQLEREREIMDSDEAREQRERATKTTGSDGEQRALDHAVALRSWLGANVPEVQISDEDRAACQRAGINPGAKQITLRLSARAPRTLEEIRAQSVGTTTAGGFSVQNETMRALEEALLQFGGMRQVATVIRTGTGASLPIPTDNDTAQKGARLAENTQASAQDISFGQVTMDAYKYSSKVVKVSVELMQDSTINLPEYIGRKLGTRIGRIQNDEFTTGTGSSQPNGIVTAATSGKVGTTGQTVTIIYDDIIDLIHSVDPAYRVNGKFMMSDNALKIIKKLKDSQNRPLWLPGLAVKEPDTINGFPYFVNQSMAVMAANAKSVIFGDLSKYLIRDTTELILIRLDELYADFHQVGFLAFQRSDGDLLDAGTHPVTYYANSAT